MNKSSGPVSYTQKQIRQFGRKAIEYCLSQVLGQRVIFTKTPRYKSLGSGLWLLYEGKIRLSGGEILGISGQVRHGLYGKQGMVHGSIWADPAKDIPSVEWWYYGGRFEFRVDSRGK